MLLSLGNDKNKNLFIFNWGKGNTAECTILRFRTPSWKQVCMIWKNFSSDYEDHCLKSSIFLFPFGTLEIKWQQFLVLWNFSFTMWSSEKIRLACGLGGISEWYKDWSDDEEQ